MKKVNITKAFVIYGAMMLATTAIMAAKLALPPMDSRNLANGLKVIFVENHEQPVVAMRLLVKSGTCLDPKGKAGLANMTAGLLRKGTATRDANKISGEIDFVGGLLGAGADLDATNVTSEVLSKHFEVGLTLLSDVVLNPTFSQEELDRLRKQTIAALMQSKDDPNTIVDEQYSLFLFGEHPYAQPSSGTVESVSGFTRDDVLGFWQKNFLPNNSVLMVVGDVNPAVMFPKIEAKFSGWNQGTLPEMKFPDSQKPAGTRIVLINKPDATQSSIKLGHLGINRYNPDIYACRVMNYILGGGGFVSRMMSDIRQKRGLTYDINSQFSYNRFVADFTVTTFTRTDSTSKAILAAIDHLSKMRDADVSSMEISETISFYQGYFPRQFETPNQVANQMSIVELYGLGSDYLPYYLDNISKVTTKSIRDAAQKYIDPKNLLIVIVGKADELRESLKQIAPVTEIELSDL